MLVHTQGLKPCTAGHVHKDKRSEHSQRSPRLHNCRSRPIDGALYLSALLRTITSKAAFLTICANRQGMAPGPATAHLNSRCTAAEPLAHALAHFVVLPQPPDWLAQTVRGAASFATQVQRQRALLQDSKFWPAAINRSRVRSASWTHCVCLRARTPLCTVNFRIKCR